MGKRFEWFLEMIPKKIQEDALVEINKVRKHFGGEPIDSIRIRGADNRLGGSNTPIGKSIADVMTPKYEDGSGFEEIEAIFTLVWEMPDIESAEELAEVWGTSAKMQSRRRYCCHRHDDKKFPVVEVPRALREYDSAVVEASDNASKCACGTYWYDRQGCTCGVRDPDDVSDLVSA